MFTERNYYILQGKVPKVVGIEEWAVWLEKANRIVEKTQIRDVEVSTVFLSLLTFDGFLFETMIFGGEHDGWCDRYMTWEEAKKGHKRAIDLIFSCEQ